MADVSADFARAMARKKQAASETAAAIPRRRFLAEIGLFASACALAPLLRADPRMAGARDARDWLQRVEHLSQQLKAARIASAGWRREIDALNGATALQEFLPQLQFQRALETLTRTGKDPVKSFVTLADVDGSLRRAAFAAAYFVFAKGQVITPHGHRGMVSAHTVVAGKLHVRTYDRLGRDAGALRLRPRLDTRAGPGFSAAISAREGNVHWFVAEQDASATLDVIVQDIDANGRAFALELVDPLAAQLDSDGVLHAPLLSWEQSSRKYQQGQA
ncbi:hypothetical protein [Tahibacter harae]|uniref:Uncharacterized protein n=1 Tax=Tahibacter harae TaxID=2963937 RepID=A0ABT1QWW8_9GAMM|nr:hypothetical protein [Tahibacter harae]MCQ4166784.1 hypothetical protein [Tahibacter harae]